MLDGVDMQIIQMLLELQLEKAPDIESRVIMAISNNFDGTPSDVIDNTPMNFMIGKIIYMNKFQFGSYISVHQIMVTITFLLDLTT